MQLSLPQMLIFRVTVLVSLLQVTIAGAFCSTGVPLIFSQNTQHLTKLYAKPRESSKDDQIEKFYVASSRGSDAIEASKVLSDKPSGWDSLKSAIYGTVEGVGSLSEKLKDGPKEPGVQGGYSNIERSVLSESPLSTVSPGQRLMNEYRARSATSPAPSPNSNSGSAFDAFKETVYGTVDAASSVFSSESASMDGASFQSFKPLVQSTISSSKVQKTLPDLQSNNPITRKLAEGKIKNWEEKERKRQRALEREEAARKFKEGVYQVGDAVAWSAEALASVPEKVTLAAAETEVLVKKVKKTVDKIPGKVDEVVTTVNTIPDQVKVTSDQVQTSVTRSVENTKKAIDEVKAIPTKIETTVKDTQEKVISAKEAVDEATTNLKVFLKLEKPKPKPPKVAPPPPPTIKELGMKIAGDIAKGTVTGTAKLAWWAGKGATVAAWNGAQAAYKNMSEKAVADAPAKVSSSRNSAGKASLLGPGTSETSSNDTKVDEEVMEALRLAQSALDFADTTSKADDSDKVQK